MSDWDDLEDRRDFECHTAADKLGTRSPAERGFSELGGARTAQILRIEEARKRYGQKSSGRAAVAERRLSRAERVTANTANWTAKNPELALWIGNNAPRFDFARSMLEAIGRYGELTENQLAAVRRLAARDAERDAARAEFKASAPVISVERIEEAFKKAAATGLKKLSLRLATSELVDGEEKLKHAFVFTPAPATGRNPGAIYVKENGEYLGKVTGGKFHAVQSCGEERRAEVVKAAADPAQSAIAYGKLLGSCSVCGAELSNPVSIERGIGPICASKYGF